VRNALVALVVLVVAVGLSTGTGGFSSVSADRNVTVDVVGDEDAYMALEYPDGTVEVEADDSSTFLTATNQFTHPVDFTIEYEIVDEDGVSVESDPGEKTVSNVTPGESFDVPVSYTCTAPGDGSATVSFNASAVGTDNASVVAETTDPRTVEYEVDCGDLEVTFQGNGGNAQVDGVYGLPNTNATVWTVSDGDTYSREVDLSQGGKNVRPLVDSGDESSSNRNAAIAAIYVHRTHETHVHSNLTHNKYDQLTIENQGGGSNEPGDPVCTGNVDPKDLETGDDGDLVCP
jgi:hypothetical protein